MNRYRGRLASIGTGSVIAAIAIVMALSPAAGASVISHPYHGAKTTFGYLDYNGCGSASTHKASFSMATGAGGVAAASSAKTPCGVVSGVVGMDSYFDSEGGVELSFPIAVHAGQTNVTANLDLSGVLSSAIVGGSTPANCPVQYGYSYYLNSTYFYYYHDGFCDVYAEAGVDAYAYLSDLTNHTQFSENSTNWGYCYSFGYCYNEVYNQSYNETQVDYGCYDYNYASPVCYSYNNTYVSALTSSSTTVSITGGTMSFVANAPSQGHTGWTFNPHHKYALFIELYGWADSGVEYVNHATAKASANFNPGSGYGWDLTSITVV